MQRISTQYVVYTTHLNARMHERQMAPGAHTQSRNQPGSVLFFEAAGADLVHSILVPKLMINTSCTWEPRSHKKSSRLL